MRFFYVLTLLFFSTIITAQNIDLGVLSQRLQHAINESPEDYHHFSILLTDRVDIAQMDERFYAHRTSLNERTENVITSLKSKAISTQQPILDLLKSSPKVNQSSIRPFWVSNIIFVKAKKEIIATLSQLPEVAWMDLNGTLVVDEVVSKSTRLTGPAPGSAEPGLKAIKAPELWKMGYTGYGRIAMGADTGVNNDHNAIKRNWRGLSAPIEQTWYNPEVPSDANPYNCGDHGSHTVGTMVGLDRNTNDTIGVAFNAQWIGSAMLCGSGTMGFIATFQWSLDPDNDPTTITDMPDVINNSWQDLQLSEGEDCMSGYVDLFSALEAAGIAIVFSAGNSGGVGNGVGTITRPKNINTDLVNVFCVGWLDGNSTDLLIAGSSSKGPSDCGGTGSLLIKPEVSAPGDEVRSCELGANGYGLKSGTSMAAPHASGAILLLKEAFPYLTGTEIKLALYFNCTDLGAVGEDNNYGMGMIDVKKAFDYLVAEGNVPVSPLVENDVIIIDLGAEQVNCSGTLDLDLKLENAGTNEVTAFDIEYQLITVDGTIAFENTISWTGNLPSGARTTYAFNLTDVIEGVFDLKVTLKNPNSQTDNRPLNNVCTSRVAISKVEPLVVQFLTGNNPCFGSEAALHIEPDSNTIYNWFLSGSDDNPIYSGNTYITLGLGGTFNFYVDAEITSKVGLENRALPTSEINPDDNSGRLIFDAHQAFRLMSVKVYAETTGNYEIILRDEANMALSSIFVNITEPGEQRIPLGFFVQKGQNLSLTLSPGDAFYHSTEANYPYNLGSILSIKRSNDAQNPLDKYYYFYDWEIEHSHPCGRQTIPVEFQSTSSIPTALFEVTNTTINLNLSGEVDFTNNSINAVSYYWAFGDGMTSTDENPTHAYMAVGTYQVVLVVTNDSGCTDAMEMNIDVEEVSVGIEEIGADQKVVLFPNPSSNQLNLLFNFDYFAELEIEITDVMGRSIKRIHHGFSQQGEMNIELGDLPNGVYYLVCHFYDEKIVRKVIKIE